MCVGVSCFSRCALSLHVALVVRVARCSVVRVIPLHRVCENCGVRFLRTLRRKLAAPGVCFTRAGLAELLDDMISKTINPERLFSASFNPNRIRRRQVRRSKTPHRLAGALWRKFARKFRKRISYTCHSPMFHRRVRKTRRTLMLELSAKLGSFTAKNYFQILRRLPQHGKLKCFNWKQPVPHMYTCTGPGARSALNQLLGHPKTWNVHARDEHTSDYYSLALLRFHRLWRLAGRELMEIMPEALREHVRRLASHEFDEVFFQFVLCELSKVLAFVISDNSIYTRGYWEHLFADDSLG